jgi:co-chaperonin GroES (HSP10)
MIQPVNNHLLIEPVPHETFIASQRETFEEIGVVLDNGRGNLTVTGTGVIHNNYPQNGDKVYFDSWLAAKYPKNDQEFYWLVKWEDIRAIEKNETIPEQLLP